jgi:hypothetical protein
MNKRMQELIKNIDYKSLEERKIIQELFQDAIVEERSGIDAKIERKLTQGIERYSEKDLNDN